MRSKFTQKIPRRIGIVGIAAALVIAAGCGLANRESSFEMPASASADSLNIPVSTDASEQMDTLTRLPVYWLENTKSGVFLYREYLEDTRHSEPIGDAINTLLSAQPAAPERYTLLKPSDDIGVSISNTNVITLDLPAKVFSAHLDEGLSERSIQQLVFTATAAASSSGLMVGDTPATVKILVDGQPNATVFDGHRLKDVYERNAQFVAPIWVIDPQFGTTLNDEKVTINGRTTKFDIGTFYSLQQKDADGKLSVITAQKQVIPGKIQNDGSFSLVERLSPGAYQLSFWGIESGSEAKIGEVSTEFVVK